MHDREGLEREVREILSTMSIEEIRDLVEEMETLAAEPSVRVYRALRPLLDRQHQFAEGWRA